MAAELRLRDAFQPFIAAHVSSSVAWVPARA